METNCIYYKTIALQSRVVSAKQNTDLGKIQEDLGYFGKPDIGFFEKKLISVLYSKYTTFLDQYTWRGSINYINKCRNDELTYQTACSLSKAEYRYYEQRIYIIGKLADIYTRAELTSDQRIKLENDIKTKIKMAVCSYQNLEKNS
ncbi:hypothetical protein ACFL96_11770, partial [Thermoproteota archaeon]